MHLVPAPAVRLMKRRVQSRPGSRQENRFPGLALGHFVFSSWSLTNGGLFHNGLSEAKEKDKTPLVRTTPRYECLPLVHYLYRFSANLKTKTAFGGGSHKRYR